ncbi:hypothetical protein POM88_047274 [Heracleum sosnowskyi]|uniref:dCTP pyrophosphatase 1 n=1 Tax=Heracleum sosnowskyi TaxID=360622 RepID=A0AAD8LZC5_9APIA|nr:hypothetical protein POM88_047274 [Heracleum sosnowskyi]
MANLKLLSLLFLFCILMWAAQGSSPQRVHRISASGENDFQVHDKERIRINARRLMIGSVAPTCTYNECRGCKFRCRAEQVPVEGNDPMNSAYHYKCICHREETTMSSSESVTLDLLKKKMADFAKERDWEPFHSPRNLLLAMIGEVGELSEIFQWKGEVPRGLPDWEENEKIHLGEELSDVLLYLVRLSDICGIDLGKAALRKIQLNAIKYPVIVSDKDGDQNDQDISNNKDGCSQNSSDQHGA